MKSVKIIFAMFFLSLCFSCSGPVGSDLKNTSKNIAEGKALISVSVSNSDAAKTIIPEITVSDLILKGSRSGGEEVEIASSDTLSDMEAEEIEVNCGEWTFTLTAKVSGVLFSDTKTCTLFSGSQNPLSFTLSPASGTLRGDLDFSLTFSGNDSEDYNIKISLKNIETQAIPYSPTYTKKSGEKIELSAPAIEEGTYLLTADFTATNANAASASNESEVLNTYQTLVRIEKGLTTRASVNNIRLNDVYSITYENFEDTDLPSASAATMKLKFSRKAGDSDGYITLPGLEATGMIFSGWYTSEDFAPDTLVQEFSPEDPAQTAVQKIKVSENLSDITLYAKWNVTAAGSFLSPADYNFTIQIRQLYDETNSSGIYQGEETYLQIISTIKAGDQTVNPSADEITWTGALYNGGKKIGSDIEIDSSKKIIKLPALSYKDQYFLKVNASYLGVIHDAGFYLDCSYSAENAASYIKTLSSSSSDLSGTYSVTVEGPLSSESEGGLAKLAAAIREIDNENLFISLDIKETSAGSEFTSYADGEYFKDCTQLKSIILPSWMEYIIHDLFNGCTALESIELSEKTQYLEQSVFESCSSLKEIHYKGTMAQWNALISISIWNPCVPENCVIYCSDGSINAF